MPKERIHHGKLYASEPKNVVDGLSKDAEEYRPEQKYPEGTVVTEEPSLDITWRNGSDGAGWVQVSIDMERRQWMDNAKTLDSDPSIVKRAIYTDVLSRDELNKAIRVLRRARDQAYGADE